MKNSEGKSVPEVTFRTREGSAWKNVTTKELFAGKTVVVFSLPGAFTPTCSSNHVPRYSQLAPVFKAKGVDDIICISVNDAFVMNAWQVDQGAENIRFIPDGNGEFTEALGLLVDKSAIGFGKRSWRYSMLVKDGVIQKQFIEPEVEGDPFQVSDAESMLRYLDKDLKLPHDVLMLSRGGCSFCDTAKALLNERGIGYDEVPANPRRLKAVSGKTTTPQIFIDGEYVGGAAELKDWLEHNA